MTDSPLEAAKKCLAIQDVFLIGSKAFLRKDFNQTLSEYKFDAQIKHAVEKEVLIQERLAVDGQRVKIARYFVEVGFRVVPPTDAGTSPDPSVIGEIEATFGADYQIRSETNPTPESLGAFAVNVMYHVWPYWREYLQSSLARMRLPPIVLAMFSVQQMQDVIAGRIPEPLEKTGQ